MEGSLEKRLEEREASLANAWGESQCKGPEGERRLHVQFQRGEQRVEGFRATKQFSVTGWVPYDFTQL